MSIATCQDRKVGKASAFFLTLSSLLLLTNIFAGSILDRVKHAAIDVTIDVVDVAYQPIDYASTQVLKIAAIWDVQKNNEMLAAENARLMEWFQTANRLNAENQALRELLNMKDEEALEFQSGKVILDAETQYSHTILVRLGENDGLEKGQGVLSHEGLIGRVIETGLETSRVLLMSDINSRIPVAIKGTQDRAILAGTNKNDPVLDHLPEGHGVLPGQVIVTSGHGGIFPYGVPVGETYKNADGLIAVKPYADPNRSNYVQVVNYGVPAGSATRATASSAGILR